MYAPWHDAIFGGRRVSIGFNIGPLENITYSGLFNAFWILLVSAAVFKPLIKAFGKIKPQPFDYAVLAYFIMTVVNVRQLDSPSVIAVENAFFLSILLLCAARRRELAADFSFFSKNVYYFFLGSYLLAFILPFFISPGGMASFSDFEGVVRYTGWVGEGTALSICGVALLILGSYRIDRFDLRRETILSVFGIIAGLVSINLNIHRTSLLGVIVFFLALSGYFLLIKKYKKAVVFLCMFIVCSVNFFSGNFASKSRFKFFAAAPAAGNGIQQALPVQKDIRAQPAEKTENAARPETDIYNFIESRIISSNGRLEIIKYLVGRMAGNYAFGMGSGAAPRILRTGRLPPEIKSIRPHQTNQTQNDYLRIFVEHGFVGFSVFLAMLLLALFKGGLGGMLPTVFAASVMMLSENIIVFPSFGYGPLLLTSMFVAGMKVDVALIKSRLLVFMRYLVNIVFLLFVAYGPWHDAPFRGQRVHVGFSVGPLANITTSGIFNFIWILALSVSAGYLLLRTYKKQRASASELLIVLFSFLAVLNCRIFDTPSMISIENSVLLCFLLLMFYRVNAIKDEFALFSRYYFPVFLLSYAAALFFPMLLAHKDAFQEAYYKSRYVGWVGEGTALSLCGWIIIAIGTRMFIVSDSRLKWLGLLASALGLGSIVLNVNRTALLSVMVYFAVLSVFLWKVSRVKFAFSVVSVFICVLVFTTGKYAAKNWGSVPADAGYVKSSASEVLDDVIFAKKFTSNQPSPLTGNPVLVDFDRYIISTNNRLKTISLFLKKTKDNHLLGLGAGSASRILRECSVTSPSGPLSPNQTIQTQNEYLRIFAEHGIVGLIMFLAVVGVFVRRFYKNIFIFPLLASAGVASAFENIFLYPAFGYGPLIMALVYMSISPAPLKQ